MNALVDGANAPIVAVDRELKITLWNSFTEKLTGFSFVETYGKPFVDTYIEPEGRDSVR